MQAIDLADVEAAGAQRRDLLMRLLSGLKSLCRSYPISEALTQKERDLLFYRSKVIQEILSKYISQEVERSVVYFILI